MARDCINFPIYLRDDPRTERVSKELGAYSGSVLFGIAMTWGEAGNHTPDDGIIRGEVNAILRRLDLIARIGGFGQAMLDAGLLVAIEGGVEVSGYAEMHVEEDE
jgi:hypothetical protein